MTTEEERCGRMVECGFHAGGGSASLACGPTGCHDEDAPIWQRPKIGSRIRWWEPGKGEVEGFLVECDGDCDHMVYVVRPKRRRSTVRISGYAVKWCEQVWRK